MLVSIPGSIRPVRFGPAGTVSAEISIKAVKYIYTYSASVHGIVQNQHICTKQKSKYGFKNILNALYSTRWPGYFVNRPIYKDLIKIFYDSISSVLACVLIGSVLLREDVKL